MSLRSKYIFALEGDETTRQCAIGLQTLFGAEKVLTFDGVASLTAQPQDTGTLVFLGHASTDQFGGYSAEKFVEKFDKLFKGKDKSAVKHVCLLGCEMGLIGEKGESLAQRIANAFADKGYKNIEVHAFAKQSENKNALYVEIIHKMGAVSQYSALAKQLRAKAERKENLADEQKEGYVRVYELTAEAAEELDALHDEPMITENLKRIDQIKANAKIVQQYANPAVELLKPQNIFRPEEQGFFSKLLKVADDAATAVSDKRQEAVDYVEGEQEQENIAAAKKSEKSKKEPVKSAEQIRKEKAEALIEKYQATIQARIDKLKEDRDKLKNGFGGRFFHMYEIETKRQKMQACKDLLAILNQTEKDPGDMLIEMQKKANELMKDERVMRSKKTSETKKLLTDISDDSKINEYRSKKPVTKVLDDLGVRRGKQQ